MGGVFRPESCFPPYHTRPSPCPWWCSCPRALRGCTSGCLENRLVTYDTASQNVFLRVDAELAEEEDIYNHWLRVDFG